MSDDPKLSRNPLAMPEDLLYGARDLEPLPAKKVKPARDVVLSTFSLYPEDLEHLNELVTVLKKSGQRGVNKSRLVRQALAQFKASDYKPPR
jgi:hypothetical protein